MLKPMSPTWSLIKVVNSTSADPDNDILDWGYPKYIFVELDHGMHRVTCRLTQSSTIRKAQELEIRYYTVL